MPKFFNIAGPCIPAEHYLVPALARLPQISGLIAAKQFFVIHAARQSGKTTLLNALEQELNASGTHVALYCSLETVQGISEAEKGVPAIVNSILNSLNWHPTFKNLPRPPSQFGIPAQCRIAVEYRHPAFIQAEPVKIAEHLGVRGVGPILVFHFKLEGVAVIMPADQKVEPLAAKRVFAYDLAAAIDHTLQESLQDDMRCRFAVIVTRLPRFAVFPPELLKSPQHPVHVEIVTRNPGGGDNTAPHTVLCVI